MEKKSNAGMIGAVDKLVFWNFCSFIETRERDFISNGCYV